MPLLKKGSRGRRQPIRCGCECSGPSDIRGRRGGGSWRACIHAASDGDTREIKAFKTTGRGGGCPRVKGLTGGEIGLDGIYPQRRGEEVRERLAPGAGGELAAVCRSEGGRRRRGPRVFLPDSQGAARGAPPSIEVGRKVRPAIAHRVGSCAAQGHFGGAMQAIRQKHVIARLRSRLISAAPCPMRRRRRSGAPSGKGGGRLQSGPAPCPSLSSPPPPPRRRRRRRRRRAMRPGPRPDRLKTAKSANLGHSRQKTSGLLPAAAALAWQAAGAGEPMR